MNKKNHHYQPRRVKTDEAIAEQKESLQQTANGEFSDDLAPDQVSSLQNKAIHHPSFVKVTADEEKAVDTDSDKTAATVITTKTVMETSPVDSTEPTEITRKHHHKSRRKKKWKRVLIIAVSIPLALIIALLGTFFVMREIGRSNLENSSKKIELEIPTEDGFDKQVSLGDRYGLIINYKGTSYVYNNDIVTLTFIGTDNGNGAEKKLHMADAVYVIAINTKTGKVKILNISRDTMTDVDVYSVEGAFIDTEELQIAYSNAYSGDGISGAENTNKSVSRLMFGLPLENYFEFNLKAVATLNDAIGGVTVKSDLTFDSPEDGHTINKGDVVTLHGREAEYYIRIRDVNQLTSNNDRMKRQQEYIKSFLGSILPVAKKDVSVITKLYSAISANSHTSLSASDFVYFASTAVSNLDSLSDIEFVKLNGEITAGIHAELRVTNDEVLSKMLDIFYEPRKIDPTDASGNTIATSASSESKKTKPTDNTSAESTETKSTDNTSAESTETVATDNSSQAADFNAGATQMPSTAETTSN